MWQRIARPDLLIYLDVSRETAQRRRSQQFPASWWAETQHRLAHARAHPHQVIDTDDLDADEVCQRVLSFLESRGQLYKGA
jgi:thymidylate kinase